MHLAISVVVCSRNRPEQLSAALPFVIAALGENDELVVVDSASTEPGIDAIARDVGATPVRLDLPGLSRARNAGIAAARRPLVAFTDDDCRPAPDWLDRLREQFADPSVGFVTGASRSDSDDRGASVMDHEGLRRFRGRQDPEGIGHGANMAFRRDLLQSLGGFDELMGSGAGIGSGEDADMLYRVLEAGWSGVYTPRASVTHLQWRTDGELLEVRYRYGVGNAAFRMKIARRDRDVGTALLASLLRRSVENTVRSLFRRRHVARALAYDAGVVSGLVQARVRRLHGPLFFNGAAVASPCSDG